MADIRRLKQTWDELGRKDPLWAILSVPDKKGNKWRLDEFFETGRREIQDVLSYLRGRNLTSTGRRVLDFGCGVGRLSQALAEHFDEVHGVDLSDSIIAIARRHRPTWRSSCASFGRRECF